MPSSAGTVTIAYPGPQVAGDFDVVIVGWNAAVTVSSIGDTNKNPYSLAAGPTSVTGHNSQSIYYAPAVKAGANSVTVNFSGTAAYPDIRILEYSGVAAANPVDAVAVASSAVTYNSGLPSYTNTVKTNNAVDLLVAGNTVEGLTTGTGGTGFTQRLLTAPDGNMAEDAVVTAPGFYSAASGPVNANSAWVMQMVAFKASYTLPADTTPPTVTITPPGNETGSGVGVFPVTVTATDNVGVTGVGLLVDGVPYGTQDVTPPYNFTVNTASFANGAHTLTATATDAAGNTGVSAPVTSTFSNSNPGNPAVAGVMSSLVPLPLVTVNSALLTNGRLLFYDGEAFGQTATVWDPVKNTFYWAPAPPTSNIFCTGMEQMADGRIIVVGGQQMDMNDVGVQNSNLFDGTSYTWTVLPAMNFPRWYPTSTILSDGRIIVNCGEQDGNMTDAVIPEIYSPATNTWTALSNSPFPFKYYYPHTFLLPDGTLIASSMDQWPIVSQVLNLSTLTWTPIGGSPALDGGTAVMYAPGKILKMGHYGDPNAAASNSTATAYTLDTTVATPTWAATDSMFIARTFHNATVLPDQTVFVSGGGATNDPGGVGNAVFTTETWSPVNGQWTLSDDLNAPRLYHSEAVLLPDGRVLISGGGRFNDDNEAGIYQFNAEFYSPPYLFKGPRPTISSVSTSKLTYGSPFTINTPNAGSITAVSLVRYGAATHTFNMSQRFLPLTFTAGSGSLTAVAPANANVAPPGNYLLFILNASGVPSVAATVHF